MQHKMLLIEKEPNEDGEYPILAEGSGSQLPYLVAAAYFKDDAEDLARAYNCHQELLRACKLALGAITKGHDIDISILEKAIKSTKVPLTTLGPRGMVQE